MGWAIAAGVLGLVLTFGVYRWLTGWVTVRSGGVSIPTIGTRPRRLAGVPEEAPASAKLPPAMEVLRHGADAVRAAALVSAKDPAPVAVAEPPQETSAAVHPNAVTAKLTPATLDTEEETSAPPDPVAPAPVTAGAASGVVVAGVNQGSEDQGEFVTISNGGPHPVALAGWKLTDEGEKHSYEFPALVLAPDASIRVHMWRGEDTETDVYVGRRNRWWNNTGDTAYLYDGAGILVHALETGAAD